MNSHSRTDHDHGPEPHGHAHSLERGDSIRIGFVALACLASWFGLWKSISRFDVIALVATVTGGYPIFKEAIAAMRAMGFRTVLLTGDASAIAKTVGEQLALDEVHAEMLPNEKVAKIQSLQAEGKLVVMVGDGINDAPALTEATVGVAMGSGTDVACESADVVLLGNDLLKFVETLQIARRCRRIIWFNFAGTLLVDGIGVALAACGMLNPLFAAFIHVSSELAFILNSARLLPAVSKPSAIAN